MKKILLSLIAMILPAAALMAQNPTPVVVELFTSEGCSSCPPADAALVKLSQTPAMNGAEVILLGEHVDYWNYIGWTDRFSSKQFSQRQSDYAGDFHLASVYTPQMVIDGRTQFVGGDLNEVSGKIADAAKQPKPAQVSLAWEPNNHLHVSVESPENLPHARVLLAVTEDGLSTQVGAGENGGRTLHHAAVVRQLQTLGKVDKGKFDATAQVPHNADWNPAQLKVAVLVQDSANGRILGASEIAWPH
ncbi:MAG: DUF1223 domain-containing protein [Candidatus Korobacteraceae bacterium]